MLFVKLHTQLGTIVVFRVHWLRIIINIIDSLHTK